MNKWKSLVFVPGILLFILIAALYKTATYSVCYFNRKTWYLNAVHICLLGSYLKHLQVEVKWNYKGANNDILFLEFLKAYLLRFLYCHLKCLSLIAVLAALKLLHLWYLCSVGIFGVFWCQFPAFLMFSWKKIYHELLILKLPKKCISNKITSLQQKWTNF